MVHTVVMQHGLRDTASTCWECGRECHAVDEDTFVMSHDTAGNPHTVTATISR
jgi:hypothetical protein